MATTFYPLFHSILWSNWKQGANTHQLTAWPVHHACAQPYHLGSGSHGQLFRPHWDSSAWHSRRSCEWTKPYFLGCIARWCGCAQGRGTGQAVARCICVPCYKFVLKCAQLLFVAYHDSDLSSPCPYPRHHNRLSFTSLLYALRIRVTFLPVPGTGFLHLDRSTRSYSPLLKKIVVIGRNKGSWSWQEPWLDLYGILYNWTLNSRRLPELFVSLGYTRERSKNENSCSG